MEFRRTQTINANQPDTYSFWGAEENNGGSLSSSRGESPDDIEQRARLNVLLALNAEISREKRLYPTFRERTEAEMMRHPVPVKKAFAYFGLMLGAFPPAAIFSKVLFDGGKASIGLFAFLIIINLICAVVGFFSGKLIGKMVSEMENRSWNLMLLTLPFIGVLWGVITGGAGGVLFFVIGAFFGAIIAAMVGAAAVPAFTIFHRLLKKGEMIERNQFLPLALGIALIISAFILGL